MLSNTKEQTQLLLSRAETSAKQIGLHTNNSKTECIKFNQGEGNLKASNGESSKNVAGMGIGKSKKIRNEARIQGPPRPRWGPGDRVGQFETSKICLHFVLGALERLRTRTTKTGNSVGANRSLLTGEK